MSKGIADTAMVESIAINSDGHVFAGTHHGKVFRSNNNAETWVDCSGGLMDYRRWGDEPCITSIAVNSNGYVFAGTLGDGLFRSVESTLSSKQHPKVYSLSLRYLEPLVGVAKIKFDLPDTSEVKITIHNIAGRNIATVVAKKLHPGRYSVEWKPDNISNGVYFCRLQAGEFRRTKKMLIVR